ncbi:MAG: hypothetical protein QOF78_2105 [Phycisphaerales bacterium]|jgi:hypothetical protein|nr:hypothetical protein [Phycisphaerales bacterium]MEA2734482.1 hypothetical protein [Humisphaera sp.]
MHFVSRATAVASLFVLSSAVLVGCGGGHDFPASPVSAILTDREAARLAELHLNDIAPDASPRDIVSLETTGKGHVIGFETMFDEAKNPPKQSRLVVVKHNGDVREVTFKD